LYDGDARIAVARSPEGEFAVMGGHEPMLAALAPGPLRIEDANGEHAFHLVSGLLHVTADGVIIVASGIHPEPNAAAAGEDHGEDAA
jgi:F-type H+-transporting ATPase subunit epsilon